MGGTDDESNLVRVTEEQHAELHFDLYLRYGEKADWVAAHALLGRSRMTDEEVAEANAKKAQPGNQHAKGVKHTGKPFLDELSKLRTTFRHYHNGVEERFCAECPEGFVPGRIGGWTKDNSGERNPRALTWDLTFQDGSAITLKGLKSWCRENDYNYSTLYSAWKDGRTYKDIVMIGRND